MDLELAGKRALITGGSKGIGFACARVLKQEGCHVQLVARTERDLMNAVDELREVPGGEVSYSVYDLSVSANVDELAERNTDTDILVNNAGAIPAGPLDAIDETTWRTAWDLKVFGYINMCRRMYSYMRGRGGVIINIIGVGGERPSADYAAGAGGNAALMGFTRALGGRSLVDGIRVVGINPGLIETDRLRTMLRTHATNQLGDAERWREIVDPDFPPGQPNDIAYAVAFLASPRSANTTGTIVTIDGGHCGR
ncbi:MAG: short-chain dehydrogenase/reductase [Gammaproteobacteria bacterium]